MAPGLRQAFQRAIFAKVPPFKIYPGAMIPVTDQESLDLLEYMNSFDEPKPLPPGVPLDEDLVEKCLQNLMLYKEFDEKYEISYNDIVNYTGARSQVMEKLARNTELIQMEALWRQIKRKKEQVCSEI